MKIIAVNISKTLKSSKSHSSPKVIIQATKRAWKLDLNKCKKFINGYVIGVEKGNKCGYYKLKGVVKDYEPHRIKFILEECSSEEEKRSIDNYLTANGINLKGIVTKYIF